MHYPGHLEEALVRAGVHAGNLVMIAWVNAIMIWLHRRRVAGNLWIIVLCLWIALQSGGGGNGKGRDTQAVKGDESGEFMKYMARGQRAGCRLCGIIAPLDSYTAWQVAVTSNVDEQGRKAGGFL